MVALGVLVPFGCGGGDPAEGLARGADTARDAQAFSSLTQGLVAAGLVRAEAGGYGSGNADLAQRLQARDPSKRFTTGPSAGHEQIQVVGGGPTAMLVVKSPSGMYLAGWVNGGLTRYYRGGQPPPFPAGAPQGQGWSDQPPV